VRPAAQHYSSGAFYSSFNLLWIFPAGLRCITESISPEPPLGRTIYRTKACPLLLYDGLSEARTTGRQYVTYVNEGVDMLHKNTSMDETVLTMDMVNPFPMRWGAGLLSGASAAAAYRYNPQ